MMIWDAHCHLSGVPGKTPTERLAQLVTFADRMALIALCVHGHEMDVRSVARGQRKQNDEVPNARTLASRAFGLSI